jgi:two-component system sensor histidine kinase HydH
VSDTSEYRPLEGLPVAITILRAGRVAYANPALTELLGVSREELYRLSMSDLIARFTPEERSWAEPLYAARTRGDRPTEAQWWMRLRNTAGQERTCHVSVKPGEHPDEQVVVVLAMEQEASVRRLAEALVAAAGEMLRCRDEQAVLELAVEAIHRHGFHVTVLLLDGEHLVHGPMRQDAQVLAAAEKLYGRPIREMRFPRASLPHVEQVLSQRKGAFFQDIHIMLERFHAPEVAKLLKDTYPHTPSLDAPIVVGATPFGLLAVQGKGLTPATAGTLELFAGMVGSALENVRHHREAAARLTELSRLQGELVAQERLSVLGEAAGVVAHEVRNPLGAILNVVAVLKREARLGPIGTSAVAMMEEEVTRLEDIVRDLLDVVRPFELRPRPLHLGELARRTVMLLAAVSEATQAQVHVEEEPDLPLIHADEALLQLALTNLLRYTLRSSPTGGAVRLVLARSPGGLSIVVEDQGAGLSGADARRVFEPFFTSRATGAGLGLAVVRRVVLAHGGTVDVKERPGGGARFELLLPMSPSEPRQQHPAP